MKLPLNYKIKPPMRRLSAAVLLICLLVSCLFSGCGSSDESKAKDVPQTLDELNKADKIIAFGETTMVDGAVEKYLYNCKYVYLDHINGYEAVKSGKIDGFVYGRLEMENHIAEGLEGVKIMDENLGDESLKVCVGISRLSKIPDLEEKINSCLKTLKEDGTIDEMKERWLTGSLLPLPDMEVPKNPDFTLVVGTVGSLTPFSYYYDNELTGFDIELTYRLAAMLNADVRFEISNFDGILTALDTGKSDIVVSDLYDVPGREGACDFSEPYLISPITVLVRDSSEDSSGIVGKIKHGLTRTFIEQKRWKIILKGFLATLEITFGAFVLANLVGIFFAAMTLSGRRPLIKISSLFSRIMNGTPVVVILLIFYYIIFAQARVSGIFVSIVAFGLTFGSVLSSEFSTGIRLVDNGQKEAALALGFTPGQTFFKVTLRQAVRHILPGYGEDFVTLLKATAVVGYVAVTDLTKASDVIRASTFDAIFPLLSTAAIYLAASIGAAGLISHIIKVTNPKRRGGEKK